MKRETFQPGGNAKPSPMFTAPITEARVLEIGREVLNEKRDAAEGRKETK